MSTVEYGHCSRDAYLDLPSDEIHIGLRILHGGCHAGPVRSHCFIIFSSFFLGRRFEAQNLEVEAECGLDDVKDKGAVTLRKGDNYHSHLGEDFETTNARKDDIGIKNSGILAKGFKDKSPHVTKYVLKNSHVFGNQLFCQRSK
jgi:hypothetical protein